MPTTVSTRGGHTFVFAGAPSAEVETSPAPTQLWLPRRHRFVEFSELQVAEGDTVIAGQVLARGGEETDFPLLAPQAGQVTAIDEHVIGLRVSGGGNWAEPVFDKLAWRNAAAADIGARIRDAGLWPTLHVAPAGEIPWRYPEDDHTPEFIVVGAAKGEPFMPDPQLVLDGREAQLGEAIDILKKVSGAARAYLVLAPDTPAPALTDVEIVRIPNVAPNDHVLVHCDAIGRGATAWGVQLQDALAIRDAVVDGRLPTERLIALGGSLVREPKHLRVKVGTPLAELTRDRLADGEARVIHGGLLTGTNGDPARTGIAPWARAVNVIPVPQDREFLWFFKPGVDSDSYMGAFLSSLFPARPRTSHAGLRGERRFCVNCTACQWVCPVHLVPNILWKQVTHDLVDEAATMGLNRCVECGLCTYVCPSKIELAEAFVTAHATWRAERAEERELTRKEGGG